MSGPKGPRTKDQRPGPGLHTKFGLPPPLNYWGDNHSKPLLCDFLPCPIDLSIQDDIQDDIQDAPQDDTQDDTQDDI